MQPDLWSLYRLMLYSRRFEEAVAALWHAGHISGEMHLGIGEEAIVAAVVSQLEDQDAMALDHRGTPPLLMRGVDPVRLLLEFLGHPDGLCGGHGGHMHLFSVKHLSASSGIVGASGPSAVGFALAAQHLRPGSVAVAFFGEGALNQGMLMESMNLAAAWHLPVLFVCKDNEWAITTKSATVTGGNLMNRAGSFGMKTMAVDGSDIEACWQSAWEALCQTRDNGEPVYLHASCIHLEGHFLGDQLIRTSRHPVKEMRKMTGPLMRSFAKMHGSNVRKRMGGLRHILATIQNIRTQMSIKRDPVVILRQKLLGEELQLKLLEDKIDTEIEQVLEACGLADVKVNDE